MYEKIKVLLLYCKVKVKKRHPSFILLYECKFEVIFEKLLIFFRIKMEFFFKFLIMNEFIVFHSENLLLLMLISFR